MLNKIDTKSLGENMEKYISLSTEIKRIDKMSRDLKKKKNEVEENIMNLLETNKLTDKEFIKGNFKVVYETTQKKDGLNQAFLKATLDKYFKTIYYGRLSNERCAAKAKELFEFILSSRKTRNYSSLKQMSI
tara:strand:- start:645 stop:1040 length:396 start_codon:yes stop_codon:yes gene_type:complete